MLSAALQAGRDVLSPALRAIFWKSLALTVALLVAAWFAVDAAAQALLPTLGPGLASAVGWLTGLALLIGLGFLLAPVTTLVAGFYLDEVADAVERAHYADDPPGRPQPALPGLITAVRFTVLVTAVNLALLLLVLLPGVNLPLFVLANAYFLGREYFEFVAARHLSPAEVEAERRAGSTRLFLVGAVIAGLMAVPLLNLATPLFATAFVEHVFKRQLYRPA
jgi:CysZ protein